MRTVVIYGVHYGATLPHERYPDATFWGMGRGSPEHWSGKLRVDAWFELHPVDPAPHHAGITRTRPQTWQWLCGWPAVGEPGHRPVYLLRRDLRCPASVRFPLADLERAFPPAPGETDRWATCMMDYILPFARLQGFERIVVIGHGVSRESRHMLAHVGILYWIAYLRGLGMRVDVEAPSWYRAPAHRYAYEHGAFRPAETRQDRRRRRRR